MNPAIRPDRPGVNAGTSALLPGFTSPEGEAPKFNALLQEHVVPDALPRDEPPKGEGDHNCGQMADLSPLAALLWQPPPAELKIVPSHPSPESTAWGMIDAERSGNGETTPPGTSPETSPASDQVQENASTPLEGFTAVTDQEAETVRPIASEALKPASPREKLSGMTVAQQELMLSRSQKANEIAATAGQELPLARFFALDVEFSAVPLQPVPLRIPVKQEGPGFPILPAMPLQTELPQLTEGLEQVVQPAPAVEIDFSLVDSINEHIQFLRAGADDSLEVSLSPDAETELFLRIEKVAGEILVQVRLDRGNFAELEFQWPHLQQMLAGQGIKVEDLATSSGTASQNHSNPERSERDEPSASSAPSDSRASTQTVTKPSTSHDVPSDRWQRWA